MAKHGVLPQVLASVQGMEAEILVAEARELTPEQKAAAQAARAALARAEAMGSGVKVPGRFLWWRGTQVESAYLHLHVARVALVDVYDEDDLEAEIPRAVARVQGALHRDDPRRMGQEALTDKDPRALRAALRRLVEDGHEATDLQHRRLRSFRNVTLLAAVAVVLAVLLTILVVSRDPDLLPLCFTEEGTSGEQGTTACPSSNGPNVDSDADGSNDVIGPSSWDIVMVTLMGLLGGLLSAVFALRHLRGLSTAYEAPVALAILKPPLGALTGVTGIVLVHGEFIPGLSSLDSQGQILAYAFLFGVGQQVFTRLVDQKAESIMEGMPSRDPATSPGEPVGQPPPSTQHADGTAGPAAEAAPDGAVVLVAEPGVFDLAAPAEVVPEEPVTAEPAPVEVVEEEVPSYDDQEPIGMQVPAPVAAPEPEPEARPAEVPAGDIQQDDGDEVDGDPPERDHT